MSTIMIRLHDCDHSVAIEAKDVAWEFVNNTADVQAAFLAAWPAFFEENNPKPFQTYTRCRRIAEEIDTTTRFKLAELFETLKQAMVNAGVGDDYPLPAK